MKPLNEFNPETHEYKIGNFTVPSVTQILTETLGNPFSALPDREFHMQRGTAVHAYAAMIARGQEFEPPDERIAGKVAAIRKFFADNTPIVLAAEKQIFSEQYQYGGTFDLYCLIDGSPYLVDWKSAPGPERTRLQIAGYAGTSALPIGRLVGLEVVLRDDGTYKTSSPLQLKSAIREFLALRACYGIKERLGVLTQKEGE